MAFTQVTVTGTYTLADSSVASGKVRFTPSEPMHNGGIRIAAPVVATLNGSGAISVSLAATDDTGTLPTGVAYRVEVLLTGQPHRSYYIVVPHTAGTLDLADVVPATLTETAHDYLTQTQAAALYQTIDPVAALTDAAMIAALGYRRSIPRP